MASRPPGARSDPRFFFTLELQPDFTLELQPDRAAEECRQGRHGAASADEDRHELRAAHLFVGKVYGRAEIAKLQVFREFVVAREAAGWTSEPAGIVPVEEFAKPAPLFGAGNDGIPDLE